MVRMIFEKRRKKHRPIKRLSVLFIDVLKPKNLTGFLLKPFK